MLGNLWNRIRNGESTAMKSLYQACYRELYAYGFKLIADKEKTKDAIHELFCEFWEKRANLPIVLHPMAYIKICLRNKLLKQMKLDSNLLSLTETTENEDTIEQPYEQLLIASQENELAKARLETALLKLTKMQRAVIELRFYNGCSYEKISQKLDLKPRTIYNHIHSALNTLRDIFLPVN